jgi:hypothetical protein
MRSSWSQTFKEGVVRHHTGIGGDIDLTVLCALACRNRRARQDRLSPPTALQRGTLPLRQSALI